MALIAEQFLVVQDGSLIQVKKPVAEELSSNIKSQKAFSSSKTVTYTIKAFLV